MHSLLVFHYKEWIELVFGGTITVEMTCHQVQDFSCGFAQAYVFGFVAFDNSRVERKIILDQHTGKPCHFHVDDQEYFVVPPPDNLDEAIELFRQKIRQYFGDLKWEI